MKYKITHTSTYSYREAVSVCHSEVYLTPRSTRYQSCEYHRLIVSPPPSSTSRREDYFGNAVTSFSFNEGFDTLQIKSINRVTLLPHTQPAANVSPSWNAIVDALRSPQTLAPPEVSQFVFESPCVKLFDELADYPREAFAPGRPVLEALDDLTAQIHADFDFDPRATTVNTPVSEVFEKRRGVCQDFAHLQIGMLRSLGLPARYVSGYVLTHPGPGRTRLVGADASHAWLAVYCGDLGWIDIDPTNNVFPTTEHITLAWGRDYGDVCPIKGVYVGDGEHTLNVAVEVLPIESP